MAERKDEKELHYHVCRKCSVDIIHYSFNDRQRCLDPIKSLCYKCLSKEFPEVEVG
jgi:hypothetical protein